MTLEARGRHPRSTVELSARLANGSGEGSLHLHVASPSSLLRGRVPDGLDLAHAALDLRARGTWRGLDGDAPSLDHHVESSLTRVSFERPGVTAQVPRLALTLDHQGRGAVHRATARVVIDAPTLDGAELEAPLTVGAEASLHLGARTAHLEATMGGPRELSLRLRADATLEADGSVQHTEQLELARFGALSGLVPTRIRDEHRVAIHPLALTVEGHGRLGRVVAPDLSGLVEWDGTLQQSLTARLSGLRYRPDGVRLVVPEVRVTAEIDERPDALAVRAVLDLPRLDFEDPTAHWTVHGARQNLRLRSRGPLSAGRLVLEVDGTMDRVEQDLFEAYPMEELSLAARFRMDGFEEMRLRRLTLSNPRGGTHIELSKTLDRVRATVDGSTERGWVRGSQLLVLRGRVEQDLARIDGAPERLRARPARGALRAHVWRRLAVSRRRDGEPPRRRSGAARERAGARGPRRTRPAGGGHRVDA